MLGVLKTEAQGILATELAIITCEGPGLALLTCYTQCSTACKSKSQYSVPFKAKSACVVIVSDVVSQLPDLVVRVRQDLGISGP